MTYLEVRPNGNSTIALSELMRQFWEMDRYPILGNEDLRVSNRLEKEAFANIENVVISDDDPKEFFTWLAVLKTHPLSVEQHDSFISLLYDFFDPEEGHTPWV